MSPKRFLLDFEVEAHGCLTTDSCKICSTHPQNEFEVHISNLAVEPGSNHPLLSMQIIIPGEDIRKAKELGTLKLNEYLHLLTFATNLSYSINKLIRIVDWTIGLKERTCIQYESYPGFELPFPVLEKDIFQSIEILQKIQLSNPLKRALKWFANGVGSHYPDDQFQYFWFVLELLAEIHKKPGKVNDQCPKCKNPLFCESCGIHPSHRPYPKQAIQQLIEQTVSDDPAGFFNSANSIRNAIMHGDATEDIEKSLGIELSDIVDSLGQAAWMALLNTFKEDLSGLLNDEPLHFKLTDKYAHQTLTASLNLKVYSSNPNEPNLDELGRTKVSLLISEEAND